MNVFRSITVIVLLSSVSFSQDNLSAGKDALKKQEYTLAIEFLQKHQKTNQKSADANYWLGEAYRQKGIYDSAQTFLERSLDFEDESEQALASIIYTYGKRGLWDKAFKKYTEVSKYHKQGILAPLFYAKAYLEADSVDKALVYYSTVTQKDTKNAEAYIGISEVYLRQNVLSSAIENLRIAVNLQPQDARLRYRLAAALLKKRALNSEDIRELTAQLQESINLDPTNEKAVYDAAHTFYRIKYWKEAATFFEKYMQLKKDNPDVIEKYAITLYNARAYTDAISLLEKTVTEKPNGWELKLMLAHSNYVVKEYKKAVELYKIIPQDSLDKDHIYRTGFSYLQLKDSANAISFFEKTLALDPDYSDAIGNLAALYLNQKKYDKAVAQYDKLLTRDKNNLTAIFYTGFSYYVLGKQDTAKQYFKQFLTLRPNNIQSHQYLGQVYSAQDSFDLARVEFEKIIVLADSSMKADPKKAEQHQLTQLNAYRMLALFSYKAKEIKNAIDNLLKAITFESKEKKDAGLHLFLAQMYAVYSGTATLSNEDGKAFRQKSIEEYKFVLKIDPKNETARKELKSMQGN